MTWIDPRTSKVKLIGVVSWGSCGKAGYPGVYAEVAKVMDWVQKVIEASLGKKYGLAKGKKIYKKYYKYGELLE